MRRILKEVVVCSMYSEGKKSERAKPKLRNNDCMKTILQKSAIYGIRDGEL